MTCCFPFSQSCLATTLFSFFNIYNSLNYKTVVLNKNGTVEVFPVIPVILHKVIWSSGHPKVILHVVIPSSRSSYIRSSGHPVIRRSTYIRSSGHLLEETGVAFPARREPVYVEIVYVESSNIPLQSTLQTKIMLKSNYNIESSVKLCY